LIYNNPDVFDQFFDQFKNDYNDFFSYFEERDEEQKKEILSNDEVISLLSLSTQCILFEKILETKQIKNS
jgi:hypothetical protein